jgi:hypothetical protein
MDLSFWYILKMYYDSSKGTLILNNELLELFDINVGVKQGGMISPDLFGNLIDDLINECIAAQNWCTML